MFNNPLTNCHSNGNEILGFHNSTVRLKTRDYSKFSVFLHEFARESDEEFMSGLSR